MKDKLTLPGLTPPPVTVYNLDGFTPVLIDAAYLSSLDLGFSPLPFTIAGLERGSRILRRRLETRTLIPRPRVKLARIDPKSELEIHNYTGACPTRVFELSPLKGRSIGCLYCLATDGSHEPEMVLYENYVELVTRVLEETHDRPHFFYFSPKTEAFQEPTLGSGIAHDILRAFVAHYVAHPRSQARLFITSKAGTRQLLHQHHGESILDLFQALHGKMQFNTSVSIMPATLRALVEPFAASIEERLAAVRMCQEHGVLASSALVQPILPPYLNDGVMREFFASLAASRLVNFKPEFLTVNMESLAVVGQLLGHFDRAMERALYRAYCAPDNVDHKKQRDRTAPHRELSAALVKRLMEIALPFGLGMSICSWLRKELTLSEALIPTVNGNGYQCLGYQTRLFDAAEAGHDHVS
jgi:DNA repair photolyase